MANAYFRFKKFEIQQEHTAMKVTTDGCLFGSWISNDVKENFHHAKTLLDIGTGTGLLTLMIEQNNDVMADAIEIDNEAFKEARKNFLSSPWSLSIKPIWDDAKKHEFGKSYDIIISNPPFYENELKSTSHHKNIAHHSDELKFNELCKIIQVNLAPRGKFYLLAPFKREDEITTALSNAGLFVNEKIYVKQSYQHDFFRLMIKGSFDEYEPETKEFSIWTDEKDYTSEFKALLKDFYLAL